MRISERDSDEEDDEEEERGRQMLGFMFGNVDDSGDLDEEYLDQDAKERLSELAQQLGSSWVDVELYAKKKASADVSGGEEHDDYDEKANDAVDYEDIQEQYEGPEVQFAQQNMQFYADAAVAGPTKLAEEDDYDEDSISEQSSKSKLESPGKYASETEDEGHEKLPIAREQCLSSAADMIAFDDEDYRDEDWDQLFGSEETTSSSKEEEEEVSKVSLPVLCQEDGKPVVRFLELFGEREPDWVIGHRKERPKREIRGRAEEDSGVVEDDEEVVYMRSLQQPVLIAASSNAESECSARDQEDDIRVASIRRNRTMERNLSFTAGEPMKVDTNSYESHVAEFRSHISDVNLDQVEWEGNILWDMSKRGQSVSGHRELVEVESSDLSDIDYEHLPTDGGVSDHPDWQRLYLVEPLSQRSSGLEHGKELTTTRHPQVLRLEARSLDKLPDGGRDELLRRINMTLNVGENNQELARGDWLSNVSWGEVPPSPPRSKVIFDLMDPRMVFEAEDGQPIRLHAAALVLAPKGEEGSPDAAEGTVTSPFSVNKFNISNDEYYTIKKPQEQQIRNAKKRGVHGAKVMHSIPAIKLQTMPPKLSKKDLANFHRPKAVWYPHHNEVVAKAQGMLACTGAMKVIVKTLSGKGIKLTVDASETLRVLKAKTAKKLGDLKSSEKTSIFYSGKKLANGSTLAQQQVPPYSVLHLVRTKIYPWPKAQRLPGALKPLQPPGAFRKKVELSVKNGHVALMEYFEERPLLLGNVGMGGRLCTYYRKQTPTDATAATLRREWAGTTLPLEPTEDSPFLGDIRPGATQSSLDTNMFRAPVFPHKVATTDFLLVRSSTGKLSLRRIDSIHVVGQQEPRVEVLAPTFKSVRQYLLNRLMVYVCRKFREREKAPRVSSDDVMSQFPSLTLGIICKRLKLCADLQKVGGEICWVMRRDFRIPPEEVLRRLVTPENVCAYESMQAGLYHLNRMGIQKLTQLSGLAAAMNHLPHDAVTMAAASHIETQLQITPWNLSSNFVEATVQGRGSLERLEITGAGDPSGQGLGFSFVRVPVKAPDVEKKVAVARRGGAVRGTDADLRRLGLEAAGEVLLKFNVPETVINNLTRWKRIAMVRKLSSEHAASGDKRGGALLNKFARAERVSFLHLQQQAREKCQDIWDRQVRSLSMADSESDRDLDSFAFELEMLLGAEEGDDGGAKKGTPDEMGGSLARRKKQISREEEIEDEEAEAAEFIRLFRQDDEAERRRKEKESSLASKDKESKKLENPLAFELPAPEQEKATITPPGVGDRGASKENQRVVPMLEHTVSSSEFDGSSSSESSAEMLERINHKRSPGGRHTDEAVLIPDPNEVKLDLGKSNALKVPNRMDNGEKVGAVKRRTGKVSLRTIKLKKSGAAVKETPAKGKVGRDALSVVCGTCGQIGHMRTNKMCPLYREEEQPVARPAAASGLLERHGTKIIIKRNPMLAEKMEKLHSPKKETLPPVLVLKMPNVRMQVKLSGAEQKPRGYPLPSLFEVERVQQHENERGLQKHIRVKHPRNVPEERDHGMKRRLDVPPPSVHTPDLSHPPKRSRKKRGEVDLSHILEGIVETLRGADCAYLFLKPVPKRDAPDYRQYVERPMDLSTIRDKVRKLKYTSREEFWSDVLQIADNAHLYNDGRNPEIPPLADKLLEICEAELLARAEELDDAEAGIQPLDPKP